jgi:Lon protease-like protein
MEFEFTLPEELPVMTLPNVALFPQTVMPLHIFEPRYRRMLKDVLASDRIFAVAGIRPHDSTLASTFEPPHRVASVGIIRACQKNANGTSDLIVQGLARIAVVGIVSENPYRRIRVRALASSAGGSPDENVTLRNRLARLLKLKARLGERGPKGIDKLLETVSDPETFVDIAAFSFCENPAVKQKLLETLDVRHRLELFSRQVRAEIESLKLRRRLQGRLPDSSIGDN